VSNKDAKKLIDRAFVNYMHEKSKTDDIAKLCRDLDMSRSSFYSMLERHGLKPHKKKR
jgi:hypothetical protein